MGLLAAVEVYVKRDHAADLKLWHGMMQSIARDLKRVRGVTAEPYVPAYPGASPRAVSSSEVGQTALPIELRRVCEAAQRWRAADRSERRRRRDYDRVVYAQSW